MSPNFQPKNDGLKIRTRGSQPSISVPIFSLFTNWISLPLVESLAAKDCSDKRHEALWPRGWIHHIHARRVA